MADDVVRRWVGPVGVSGLAMAVVIAVLFAGCTSAGDGRPAGLGTVGPVVTESAAPEPSVSRSAVATPGEPAGQGVVLRSPRAATVVVGGGPQALSVGVSRELFETAAVVVVAAADDGRGQAQAARQAERLGVPLLLAGAPSGRAELAGEVRRLRPRMVLAVGAVAGLSGMTVVTDPAAVPAVRPAPARTDDVVVLVRGGGDPATRAGALAATATARAARARVVPVRGGDPRADPSAIRALAAHPPRRVLAAGDGFGPVSRLAARLAVAATGRMLPGGGQVMFPGRRLVALYGHPGAPALGVLGEQDAPAAVTRAGAVAAPYRRLSGVPVVPTFEIIATVATSGPGPDGNYSAESTVAELRPWVLRAGAAGMYVVLDLQPGRADFLTQAKRYQSLLALPHVGLALDPEWRLAPGQLPLHQIGSVDSGEINRVIAWLADLTARNRLPQKVVVLHEFRVSMIGHPQALDTRRDELAVLIHMDGQGPTSTKDNTWRAVTRAAPRGVVFGWKNFYDEDHPILSPAQTMTRRPTPLMISYQ